ncbi:hypothetical protein HK405_004069, partial [Cladochytrium tenue]
MRATFVATVLSALFAVGSASAAPAALARRDLSGFTVCSASTDPLTLTGLTYTDVVPGSNVTVTLTGDLTTEVTAGATAHVVATWLGFITVIDETVDICSSGATCPVEPGTGVSISFSFGIPAEAPSGVTVDVVAQGYNADGSELVCVENTAFTVA